MNEYKNNRNDIVLRKEKEKSLKTSAVFINWRKGGIFKS